MPKGTSTPKTLRVAHYISQKSAFNYDHRASQKSCCKPHFYIGIAHDRELSWTLCLWKPGNTQTLNPILITVSLYPHVSIQNKCSLCLSCQLYTVMITSYSAASHSLYFYIKWRNFLLFWNTKYVTATACWDQGAAHDKCCRHWRGTRTPWLAGGAGQPRKCCSQVFFNNSAQMSWDPNDLGSFVCSQQLGNTPIVCCSFSPLHA